MNIELVIRPAIAARAANCYLENNCPRNESSWSSELSKPAATSEHARPMHFSFIVRDNRSTNSLKSETPFLTSSSSLA